MSAGQKNQIDGFPLVTSEQILTPKGIMSESKYSTQGQQKSQRERAKTFPSMDDYYENSFLRN